MGKGAEVAYRTRRWEAAVEVRGEFRKSLSYAGELGAGCSGGLLYPNPDLAPLPKVVSRRGVAAMEEGAGRGG